MCAKLVGNLVGYADESLGAMNGVRIGVGYVERSSIF
jgi:hypothetical protein